MIAADRHQRAPGLPSAPVVTSTTRRRLAWSVPLALVALVSAPVLSAVAAPGPLIPVVPSGPPLAHSAAAPLTPTLAAGTADGRAPASAALVPSPGAGPASSVARAVTSEHVPSIPAYFAGRTTPPKVIVPTGPVGSIIEGWLSSLSLLMTQSTGTLPVTSVALPGTNDGRALRLQLNARPAPGPRQGVNIASLNPLYRYGTYGSRMRSADCRGQNRPGVVTGVFVYAMDHSDADRDGLPDNDEIDFEFLCSQPEVVWMTLWTDYDEPRDIPRQITRAVNLRTGQVLLNCYHDNWSTPCKPLLPGENSPTTVAAVPGFDSSTQFWTYSFDWQPTRVTFRAASDTGRQIVLWDYRGPTSRIPQKPAAFMQNVWHTRTWHPFNGPAGNQPTAAVSAYLDSTILPRLLLSK